MNVDDSEIRTAILLVDDNHPSSAKKLAGIILALIDEINKLKQDMQRMEANYENLFNSEN